MDEDGGVCDAGSVVLVAKPCGMTPLEALRAYVSSSGSSQSVRRSYAGRLDPMAEGLLLVLEGSQCALQEQMQHHDKSYAWELLLGLSSDSYDILGLGVAAPIGLCSSAHQMDARVLQAQQLLQCCPGPRWQSYPPFSSARVRGHPLFWWAQQGRLDEIVVPRVQVIVHACRVAHVRWIAAADVLRQMIDRIRLVSGDGFRQEQIIQRWKELLTPMAEQQVTFPIISVVSYVSSGTYIRALAHDIGNQVQCGGLAWRICRTSLGSNPEFLLRDAFHLEPISKETFLAVFVILKRLKFIGNPNAASLPS